MLGISHSLKFKVWLFFLFNSIDVVFLYFYLHLAMFFANLWFNEFGSVIYFKGEKSWFAINITNVTL